MEEGKNLMAAARRRVKKEVKNSLLVMFLFALVLSVFCEFLLKSSAILGAGSKAVGWCELLVELLMCALPIGLSACFLDLAKTGKVNTARLFAGYAGLVSLVKAVWLVLAQSILLWLWIFVLVVPFFIKIYSYSMSFFALLENPKLGAFEAINVSRRLMYGNKVRLFKLHCRFLGWFLLVPLTCGLAAFWVVPYYYTAKAEFYLKIKAEKEFDVSKVVG